MPENMTEAETSKWVDTVDERLDALEDANARLSTRSKMLTIGVVGVAAMTLMQGRMLVRVMKEIQQIPGAVNQGFAQMRTHVEKQLATLQVTDNGKATTNGSLHDPGPKEPAVVQQPLIQIDETVED